MFEEPKKDEQETKKMREIIGAATLVIILVLLVFYFTAERGALGPMGAAAPAVPCVADPVNDLTVVDAKMDKDRTGTTALWVVHLRNKSSSCALPNTTASNT